MTAEYEITKDDLIAFNVYHNRHSPTARRQYLRSWLAPALVMLLLCCAIWYLASQQRGAPWRTLRDLLPLFASVPFYLVYFPWAYRRKLRKVVDGMLSEGQNRGLLGRHRITLTPETVTRSDEHTEASTAWRAVERVVATEDSAYIYLNAVTAVIVPRRAFAETAGFEEFVRTARKYQEQAAG